jgi:acyl-CoA dehydrogenase
MAGYRASGPYSVERHLRDAYSAACMIGNDRLHAANAAMLLLQKET